MDVLAVIAIGYFVLSLALLAGILWRSGIRQSARLKEEQERRANSSKDSPER